MKKSLLAIAALMMATVLLCTSCSLRKEEEKKPAVMIPILQNEATEYSLAYDTRDDLHRSLSNEFASKLVMDYLLIDLDRYDYTEEINEKEILIGATDRRLSRDLVAAVNEKAKTAEIAWGYAYRDGKLAYYANGESAKNASWSTFIELICKDKKVEVEDNLWVVDGMTQSQYDEYMKEIQDELDAELEAERKEKIAVLKERIASISADFPALPDFSPLYGMPSMQPSYSHPRVWVNEDTLPTVIANLSHSENKEAYKSLLEAVDLDYTGRLPRRKAGEMTNFASDVIPNHDAAKIEALAFMYLVTGDELYGYSAIRAAKNFLDTVDILPDKDSWTSDELYYISNSCSSVMGVMGEVYDWCYDLLHENDKKFIVEGVVGKLAPTLEVKNPPVNTGSVTGHSVSMLILRDWLSFAIAVADEYPDIYNRIVGVLENAYAKAPNYYYHSGSNFQGSAYGINKTYLHLISEMLVMIATGEKLYADDVSFEATTITYLSYIRPDGESMRIGDDYRQWGTYYRPDNRMAAYGAFYYSNPILKAWAINLTNNYRGVDFSGNLELTPIKVLMFNNPELEYDKDQIYDLPLINYNGDPVGAIIARSAWGDPDAWMTYTNLDGIYGGNHDHKDAGVFQIYYKGVLAPNSSCYQYITKVNGAYGSLLDYAYNKQTISKNGLLIYNPAFDNKGSKKWEYSGGQSIAAGKAGEYGVYEDWIEYSTYDQADELGHAWGYTNSGELVYAYLSGDITRAYDPETVDLVMRSTISIATGDENHPLLFIVYDRVAADKASFKKSYLLHTTDEPIFTDSANVSEDKDGIKTVTGSNVFYYTNQKGASGVMEADKPNDKYNGKLTHTTLLPEDPTYTVIGGDGKRFWVNGRNLGVESGEGVSLQSSPVTEVGWGRVELSPSAESKIDSFLNVMYVGDADKNDAYVPATLVQADTHEGAISFGNCVMFSKTNKLITDTFSFTAEADGELTYYVSGISEGKWQVLLDGQPLTDVKVEKGAGIATFKADAGEITFVPKFERVSFELNGGECDDLPTVYNNGEATQLPTPEKYGSEFLGWYETPDFSGEKITEIGEDESGEKKFYAKWHKLFDLVIFHNLKNATVNGELPDKIDAGQTIVLPADVYKDNAIFDGWYLDSNYTQKVTEIVSCDKDINVYAKFTVHIELDRVCKDTDNQINGGTNILYGNYIADDPDKALTMTFVADQTDLTSERDGHIRVRTNTGSHAVLPIILLNNEIKDAGGTVISTYDKGDKIDIVMDFDDFELRYYINGQYLKTITDVGFSTNLNNYNFNIGGSWTYLWQYHSGLKDSDFTLSITQGDSLKSNKGYGLVNIEANGGVVDGATKIKYFNGETVQLPTPIKIGSEFLGWYDNAEFDGDPVTEISYEVAKDVTVYAKWNKLFAVLNLNLNGGTLLGDFDATLTADTTVVLPDLVSKEGELFVGWYLDKALTEKVGEIYVESVENDIDVYAGYVKTVESQVLTAEGGANGARLNYANIINGADDKCITMVLILDNTATGKQRDAVIRIRTNEGQNAVIPVQFENDIIKDMNGNEIASFATNSRIDITLDFDDFVVSYYVDGKYVGSVANVGFSTSIGLYNFSNAPVYRYLWQYFGTKASDLAIGITEGNLYAEDKGYGRIDYVTNGGEIDGESSIINLGREDITLLIPVREGYEFLGWYDNQEFSGSPVTVVRAGDTEDKVFYASWKTLYNMVEFETNGGQILGNAEIQIFEGAFITLPAAVYKDGYIFDGWYYDEALTESVKYITVTDASQAIKVYAKYTECIESKINTNTDNQISGAKDIMYGDKINASEGKLTFTFFADNSDLSSARLGNIRIRTNGGKNEVSVIKLNGNDINNADGTRIAGYEDGVRIDIVADFVNDTLKYYVDGVYDSELDAAVDFNDDISLYNFNIGGSWTYLWQYNAQGTDSDFIFAVSAGDIMA